MFITVGELVGVPGLPGTSAGIRYAMNKRANELPELVRKRKGTKAFEYHIDCLPPEAREFVLSRMVNEEPPKQEVMAPIVKTEGKCAVAARQGNQALEMYRNHPVLLERALGALTDDQKTIADARATLANAALRLMNTGNMTRKDAVNLIATSSQNGTLSEAMQQAAIVANARKGSTRCGVGKSSLQQWLSDYLAATTSAERLVLLAPGQRKAHQPDEISWLPRFLPHWRNTNGPSMKHCYREFRKEWERDYHDQPARLAVIPSYDAVRRVMNSLPKRERLRGRVTGAAARALEVYSRRDWSTMPVNGCWICDGKSLDMKVKHPISKHAFTPELTLVIDGRTRFVVGWSLSYSENVRGVSDAYRYGIQHHGKPLFVYTDNGSGQKNKTLDAEVTGIFPRLGIDHMTGIPGNPQARGIIERLNGVIPYAIAQRAPTYNGRGADRDSLRRLMVAVESAENAQDQGKLLDMRQRRALEQVPEWGVVLGIIQEEVDKYNNEHEHSELPKYNGKYLSPARYRAAVLEAEGDDIEYLTEIELREMFMPEETRTVERGWVRLNNNHYFSNALADFDGLEVRVAYDMRSAEEVIIRRMDGSFICKAVWNGNTRDAVPVSEIERQIQNRATRQVALLDKKKRHVIEQATPAIEVKPEIDISRFMPSENEQRKKIHIFESEFEHEQNLKKHG